METAFVHFSSVLIAATNFIVMAKPMSGATNEAGCAHLS